MEHVTSVVADDRELQAGVLRAFSALAGVQVITSRLPLGDYLVDDKLLFEKVYAEASRNARNTALIFV